MPDLEDNAALERPPPRAAGDSLPEGDEAPPPGARTMAVVRWALVALMAVVAAGAWLRVVGDRSGGPTAGVQYRCPMHPAVAQAFPGECPICGMDLVAFSGPSDPRRGDGSPAASPSPGAVPGLAPVELPAQRAQLAGMRTARVERRTIVPRVRAVAYVAADDGAVALVTARTTGWIEEVRIQRAGQRVSRGEILATMSSPELLTAQQVFLNAIRWADPSATGAVRPPPGPVGVASRKLEQLGMSQQDIDAVARGGRALDVVPIRSPIAGLLARSWALTGLNVQPGGELFQVADLTTVLAIADVFEADSARVRAGQPARLTVAAYPGEAFDGRVELVSPAVDRESRTLQARIRLRNDRQALRPGMHGEAAIEAGVAQGLTVPADAVVDNGELRYVIVARDGGRFEPRRVRLGVRADDLVQVLEGVAEGEQVVTTANFLVDAESRLRAAVEGFGAAPAAGEHERHEHADREGRPAPAPARF